MAALRAKRLIVLVGEGGTASVGAEIVAEQNDRLRSVIQEPDGALYVARHQCVEPRLPSYQAGVTLNI